MKNHYCDQMICDIKKTLIGKTITNIKLFDIDNTDNTFVEFTVDDDIYGLVILNREITENVHFYPIGDTDIVLQSTITNAIKYPTIYSSHPSADTLFSQDLAFRIETGERFCDFYFYIESDMSIRSQVVFCKAIQKYDA